MLWDYLHDHAFVYSDLHLTVGEPPALRDRAGHILVVRDAGPVIADDLAALMPSDVDLATLVEQGQGAVDFAATLKDIRYRVNASWHDGQRLGVVMRRINDTIPALDSLGLPEVVSGFLARSSGIIQITGATGSGKSTTMAALLARLCEERVRIITIEDPVEYQLRGIGQIQVNPRISLTFASGLRSILRQDPDVILIGEIRDTETAEIAIQASLTGHLVFSTLHTNDAPSAMTRLIDMGVEPFLISTSVRAVLAQRLVRRICPSCRAPYRPGPDEIARLEIAPGDLPEGTLFRGTGCAACLETGYKGRQGIYELFVLDDEIAHLVNTREDASALREAGRRKGMKTLMDDGRRKVLEGATTIEEVLRVAQSEISTD